VSGKPAPAAGPDLAERLNGLDAAALSDELRRCCASEAWIAGMTARAPFADAEAVFEAARDVWWALGPADWREAFAAHPRIGDRSLGEGWSKSEQAGVEGAPAEIARELARGNDAYERRFGFVFLVCATGSSAAELLAALKSRLGNEPDAELRIAATEQAAIMRLRLARLAGEA
jgi:2-oxo-4-hydroxy-4-carboxy-5-ureidoimidazoline decarboxylase